MDNTQIPSFEIPKSAEATPIYKGGQETDPSLAIDGTREILPAPAGQQFATVASSGAQPQMATPSPMQAVSSNPAAISDAHIIADDVDVIEKEWVERAKKIVSLTSDDPYVETKEIGKLKATYLKKRFNKDIPMPSDGAE